MRRQGDEKIADGERGKERLKRDIEEQKKLALAGQMAFELYEKNCEKSVSCGRAATVFMLPYTVVEANLNDQIKEKRFQERKQRYQTILKMHSKGLSIRKIAANVSCSGTTVQKAIERSRRIKKYKQRAVNMRKKGLRAHEIAKALEVHVSEVFEMLERLKTSDLRNTP